MIDKAIGELKFEPNGHCLNRSQFPRGDFTGETGLIGACLSGLILVMSYLGLIYQVTRGLRIQNKGILVSDGDVTQLMGF